MSNGVYNTRMGYKQCTVIQSIAYKTYCIVCRPVHIRMTYVLRYRIRPIRWV